MQTVTTIGLDIAKSVFQVHGIDAEGKVVIRRQLKRRYVLAFFQKLAPCLVGIEACASSHHWSRELKGLGHTVRLMPPAYVKPYVKRQKNDAADAEAICEAGRRHVGCKQTRRCRSERAVPYKSHVGALSAGPKHHDVVRLRGPSFHAGRADLHPRNGKPDCAWLVVEEPFERDGGNVALDDIAPDLRCVAGR